MSIVLDCVTKSIGGKYIVRDIALEIKLGELFVLIGASGSGKSTLLRLIAGLLPVDCGKIYMQGREVTGLPPQKRNTGFVFQNYSLFSYMSVAKNIEFPLTIRRVALKERSKRVRELLSLIGMEGMEERMPSQLSGGQQQRVALARALAHRPEVLLLDEPFGALDAKIRVQLRQKLREIQQELGVTTILVTHDQDEAFEIGDRLGVIDHGKLLEVGTPNDLYQRPQQHFTASFLGSANLLRGQQNGSKIILTDIQQVTLFAPRGSDHSSGPHVEIFARPEEVELALRPEDLQGQRLGLGKVERVTFVGPLVKVMVSLIHNNGIVLYALLAPKEARKMALELNMAVWIGIREFHLLKS
jgi:sulfate transport system ATP-binding protein